MAKTNEGANSAETTTTSEADSILEFLPEAAALLSGGDKAAAKPAEDPDAEETEDEEESESEETEVEAEEEQSEEADDEKPAAGEKVQKRIDKLTARAKTAEEKVTAAEAELEKVRAEAAELREAGGRPEIVAAPSAQNPLSDVPDVARLAERVDSAQAVKRWCIENPDGGTVRDKDGREVEFEPAQVRKMLADAEELLTVHAPRRERFLSENEAHTKTAREVYPEMFKRGTEMEKTFQNLVKAWPEVTRFPDYHLVLGDYIAGFGARGGRKAAAEKTVEKKVKPTIAPPVPKVASPKQKANPKVAAVGRVLETGGSLDALTKYFAG